MWANGGAGRGRAVLERNKPVTPFDMWPAAISEYFTKELPLPGGRGRVLGQKGPHSRHFLDDMPSSLERVFGGPLDANKGTSPREPAETDLARSWQSWWNDGR